MIHCTAFVGVAVWLQVSSQPCIYKLKLEFKNTEVGLKVTQNTVAPWSYKDSQDVARIT